MNLPRIFISIAAYREFDLVTTVRNALANAEAPDRLRFCICWQHAEGDSLEGLDQDPRVEVIAVPHLQSKGVCWARHMLQKRYGGEAYFLQIDGHHRFAPRWDQRLIDMLEGLRHRGARKPILTNYLPGYDPHNDPAGRTQDEWFLGFDRFEPEGVVFMRPFGAPGARPTAPVPCRFWSAHFSFSDGRFCEEVPIDPHLYFHAEEITTCVRAWTLGYDLFVPHETLLWHEYSRKGRVCHWDDHSDWGIRNAAAIARYRGLFGIDGTPRFESARYGFGAERSFHDYERFAGVCFDCRGLEPYTIANGVPPGPLRNVPEPEWREALLYSHSRDIHIERDMIADADSSLFLGVFANAADGTELYRMDYPRHQLDEMLRLQTGPHIQILISFFSRSYPVRWTAWTGSSQGWKSRVDGDWPPPSGPVLETLPLE